MRLLEAHTALLPLLVLAGTCLYTIGVTLSTQVAYEGTYYDRSFSFSHYLAFAAVTLNLVLYFYCRPLFKFTVMGMLLLGICNILCFTPDEFTAGVGMSDTIRVSIQPFSLLLAIAVYTPNREAVNGFLKTHLLPSPSPHKLAEYQLERVAAFKATFARNSDESLRQIVRQRAVVPDALEAASQLLRERAIARLSSVNKAGFPG